MANSYNSPENKKRRAEARKARQQRLQKLGKSIDKAKDKITPKNKINKTGNKLKIAKNNIKKTGAPIDSEKLKSSINRMGNELKIKDRRDYIAKTTRAGVDEFNNTKMKAKKGGITLSTKELAKFNKGKLIRGAAKGLKKGRMGVTILELAARAAEAIPSYGKKLKKARKAQDKQRDDAYKAALQQIGR